MEWQTKVTYSRPLSCFYLMYGNWVNLIILLYNFFSYIIGGSSSRINTGTFTRPKTKIQTESGDKAAEGADKHPDVTDIENLAKQQEESLLIFELTFWWIFLSISFSFLWFSMNALTVILQDKLKIKVEFIFFCAGLRQSMTNSSPRRGKVMLLVATFIGLIWCDG